MPLVRELGAVVGDGAQGGGVGFGGVGVEVRVVVVKGNILVGEGDGEWAVSEGWGNNIIYQDKVKLMV